MNIQNCLNMKVKTNKMAKKETSIFNPTIVLLSNDNKSYLNGFYCGVDSLDRYVKENALNDSENGNGVTYLVKDADLNTLVAYYTLSASSIPNYKQEVLSAISIDMFAVSNEYQDTLFRKDGKDILISDFILGGLIGEIYAMSNKVLGIKYITLHALLDAVPFYERNCFIEVTEDILPNDSFTKGCKPMVFDLFSYGLC